MINFYFLYNQMILISKIKVRDISPATINDALPEILNRLSIYVVEKKREEDFSTKKPIF
jgi:hypothetical protein